LGGGHQEPFPHDFGEDRISHSASNAIRALSLMPAPEVKFRTAAPCEHEKRPQRGGGATEAVYRGCAPMALALENLISEAFPSTVTRSGDLRVGLIRPVPVCLQKKVVLDGAKTVRKADVGEPCLIGSCHDSQNLGRHNFPLTCSAPFAFAFSPSLDAISRGLWD
jgi:hypothetical protein